jgi:dienelactone hydrolase
MFQNESSPFRLGELLCGPARSRLRMKRRTLLSRFDEFRALGVDIASFGFVNLLQARHRLPANFRERWDLFSSEWAQRPVEQFYEIPPGFVPPTLPDQGRLTFASPYPGEHPENNTAAFDFFPCQQGWSAPTMLLAHGLMSVSDIGYRLWARRLNARGWNAVFVHLPYHYSRRLPWHFHGELSVGGELLRSAFGVRQSVVECRVVLQQLAKKGGKLFGAWGTSYGGWIMALLGCFEPLLQRLILVEPILHIDNAIWRAPSSVTLRAALRRIGLTPEHTSGNMRLVCPARQQPVMEGRHILMLAGQYDKIAPPEEIEELSRLWRGSHFASFPQGHVGYTLMPESFRMAQEIWASDFPEGKSFFDPDLSLRPENS